MRSEGHAADNPNLFESSIALVVVEIRIEAIIGNEQVWPPIVVIVGGADGKILAFWLIDFRRNRHVAERTVAVVVIKRVRTAPINARSTTAEYSSQIAITFLTQIHVASNIKIEPAIAIVIEKCRPRMKRSGLRTGDAGLVGNVGERPIAIVVVQNVASILRYEKIGKAVVIVVAPDTTQAVTRTRNSGLVGHIRESAIAIIAVQRVA